MQSEHLYQVFSPAGSTLPQLVMWQGVIVWAQYIMIMDALTCMVLFLHPDNASTSLS